MSDLAQLLELIGAIYDAALDPLLWPRFLELFAQACKSSSTLIFMHDFSNSEATVEGNAASIAAYAHFDDAFISSFAEHYNTVNVWVKNEDALQPGIPLTGSMLYPNSVLGKTEWYGDWLRPQNLFYALGGIVLREGTLAVKFSSLRSREKGDFGPAQMSLYARLIPHLRRACELHKQLSQVTRMRDAGLHLLDSLAVGIVLLDSSGRAMFANRAARDVVKQADGLLLDASGKCSASFPGESGSLQNLIDQSVRTGKGESTGAGGTIRLSRTTSVRPLSVLVSPLPAAGMREKYQFSFTPVAILMVGDPDMAVETPEDVISNLYGLTKAEARLAAALVGGLSIDEYVKSRQISRNTVATHLKRILAKTGSRRQSDIVRMILTGPAALRLVSQQIGSPAGDARDPLKESPK